MELRSTDYSHRGDDGKLDFPEVRLEVRLVKRTYGGWHVVRADNNRELGWLTKGKFDDGSPCWEARVASAAFRGDGPDDEGYILDDVPLHLFNGRDSLTCDPVGYGRTRQEAAEELFYHLRKHEAPAVGFGRKYSVKRWHDSHPDIRDI